MEFSTQALIAAVLAVVIGIVLYKWSTRFKDRVDTLVVNPNFRRFGLIAVIIGALGFGFMQILGGITGLPWWANLELVAASCVFLGIGFGCYLISLGGWSSGRTVWIILLMIWIVSAVFFFGGRVYLFGASMYQWNSLFTWIGFTLVWVGLPVAFALWLLLGKIEGDRRALGAFVVLALMSDTFVVMDHIQYPSQAISPWTGELVVKASIHPDGSAWPVPLNATFERGHPGYRTFRILDLDNEADDLILEDWAASGVSVGDKEAEVAARRECEKAKAAAKAAGKEEPVCSVTGAPLETAGSAIDEFAEVVGLGKKFAGLSHVEYPFHVSLDAGQAVKFREDLVTERFQKGPVQIVVCDAVQPNKLQLEVGGYSIEQSMARPGVVISVTYSPNLKTGEQVVTVTQPFDAGHIEAVVGHGNDLVKACPQSSGSVGALIGRIRDMKEQGALAAPAPAPTTP